jgi:hypothetical protein
MMAINYGKLISILALALNFNVIVVAKVFSKPKLCKFLLKFSLMIFIRIFPFYVFMFLIFTIPNIKKLSTIAKKQNVYLCLIDQVCNTNVEPGMTLAYLST